MRQAAFDRERAEWEASGEFARAEALIEVAAPGAEQASVEVPDGCILVESPLGGSLWRMLARPGDRVEKGAVIAVIEAMKAECDVTSPQAGVVAQVYAQEGQSIAPGAALIALTPA